MPQLALPDQAQVTYQFQLTVIRHRHSCCFPRPLLDTGYCKSSVESSSQGWVSESLIREAGKEHQLARDTNPSPSAWLSGSPNTGAESVLHVVGQIRAFSDLSIRPAVAGATLPG